MKNIKTLLILMLIVLALGISGANAQSLTKADKKVNLDIYPISTEVFTTRQRTVIPDILSSGTETIYPDEISKYEKNGYGKWHYGLGIDSGKQLNIMPSAYNAASVTNVARLLNFFTITDIHLTDEESPVQAIYSGYHGGNSSAYSPVMMLTTQVLDAVIQTANALHQQKPFDFCLGIGDAANGSQYNELRWYIDILDGQNITPDSGVKDDPVPGPYNDYQDSYKAAGLDKSIPWYQTLGNHDHSWLGSYPVTDYLRKYYTGLDILLMGDLFKDGPDSRIAFLGSIDGTTPDGNVIGAGLVADFTVNDVLTTPTVRAADQNRRPLSRPEWMNEFLTTTSNPVGHGFTQYNIDNDIASYSFEPKPSMPVKVIVLDDTQLFDVENMDQYFKMHEQGYVSQDRFNWLVNELDEGQTNGKLMIISAHIPLGIIGISPPLATDAVTQKTLLTKLSQYSNLILWVAGHRHRNVVTPRPSIDPAYPGAEYGFWEVETASLRDFPQQFRTFEIVRNSDNNISIFTTDVDPAVKEGSLAAKSRSYAVAADYLFDEQNFNPPSNAYNAELIKQLSVDMQNKMQNYGDPITPTPVPTPIIFDFNDSSDGWNFSGRINELDAAISSVDSEHVGLNAQNSSNCFGFFLSPSITLTQGKLYRVRWTVSTNIADPDKAPEFRLRATTASNWRSWTMNIVSQAGASPTATVEKTYDLYIEPQMNSATDNVNLAFDILSMNPNDDCNAWIYLDRVVIEEITSDNLLAKR